MQSSRKSENNSTARTIVSLMRSNLAVAVIGAVASILQARFVSPEDLGFFRQFGIITGYLFFLHFGTYQAVERLYPLYVGRGEIDKARSILSTAETWILFISVPCAAVFAVLSVNSFIFGNWRAGLGWLSQSIAMITTVYGGYVKATYRSGQDFKRLANIQMITSIVTLLIIPIYPFMPYFGLFLKNTNTLPATVVMYQMRPERVKRRFSFKNFKEILKNGLPRFSSSYALTTGIEAIRATVVLSFLGQVRLGYWSFSWTILGLLKQIPQSVSAVYAPKITQEYGKSGNLHNCLRMCKKPFGVTFLVVVAMIPLSALGSFVFVPWLIPKYAEAKMLIFATIVAMLPSALLDLPWQVINSTKKIVVLNLLAIMDMATQCVVMILTVALGVGVYSIIFASIAGTVVRALGMLIFFVKVRRKKVYGE